jgi:hypothetical protein
MRILSKNLRELEQIIELSLNLKYILFLFIESGN